MKAFVITIMDMEESVKSAERCIASAARNGLTVEKFRAITPKDKPAQILYKENIPIVYFSIEFSRTQNAIACFCSHYMLWKECARQKHNYLIFEHDAVVKTPIPTDIPFKGCISYGKPSYGKYINPPYLGINELTSKDYFPGAHAYMISPRFAQKLVERATVDAGPTDVYLHKLRFTNLQEYYPWPVEVDDSFTTVQNITGCQAKHNFAKLRDKYQILEV